MADWVVPESRTQPVLRGEQLAAEMTSTAVPSGEVAAWWLTQASWMLKFPSDGTTEVQPEVGDMGPLVLIDPWWRDLFAGDRWGKLLGEFPLEPEQHPQPMVICCTHWHDDHICPVSIPRLAAAFPDVPIIIPNRSRQMVLDWGVPDHQLISMYGDDEIVLIAPDGSALFIHAIPAAHEEFDVNDDGSLYLGFLISNGETTVLHMGDSQPYEGWHERINEISEELSSGLDLAFACINGNDNLRHDEAVDLALECSPRLIVPMHYGMDPGNTVDPEIFAVEMQARAEEIHYQIPQVGERIITG